MVGEKHRKSGHPGAIIGTLLAAALPLPGVAEADTADLRLAQSMETAPQAQPPAPAADAPPPAADAAATTLVVTPNPNRGYGGKAANSRLVRKLQRERLKALRDKPQTGEMLQDWLTGPSILGEGGGTRQELEEQGVSFGGFSANSFFTNATGGNRRSWTATTFTMAAADLDFERLAGLPGLRIHTEMAIAAGNNLSNSGRIGNLFNIATGYAPNGVYLSQMYAQQEFGDDATLQLGRLTTTTNFGTLPVFTNYVSVAGNGTPTALPIGSTYFTFPPAVEWGAVGTLHATSTTDLAVGVYNTNNSSADPQAAANGTDFGLTFNNGVMTVAQATWDTPATPGIGLPGIYALGGFYASGDYPRLRNGRDRQGNYGFYGMAQQMVYSEGGPGNSNGLTPWLAIAWNPTESADFLPLFVSAGAVYQGLIRGRDADTTALAVYTGKFSKFSPNSSETVVEANYTLWATPWLGITPDFQYVFNPLGNADIDDAAVFGGQVMVIF